MDVSTIVGLPLDGPQTFEDVVAETVAARALGFPRVWSAQVPGSWDALHLLGTVGVRVPDVGLATGVVPTYPRHPLALAGEALTVQAATGNRLTLGVGVSHEPIIRGAFGLPYERPARHLREYLSVLQPLLRGEAVDHHGETLTAVGAVAVAGAEPPPVLVAALGPAMLQVAGELADGTVATWVGPKSLESHVVPRLTAAARSAGRPDPQVVVCLPVSLTDDEDAAREQALTAFGAAHDLPAYRSMLDREGQGTSVSDVSVVGDESSIERQLARLEDAGVTELIIGAVGSAEERARTVAFLADLAAVPRP
jgi:F420-dependent oxidoreductase-like protein